MNFRTVSLATAFVATFVTGTMAFEKPSGYLTATAFHPGKFWPDNNGVHINAHGCGILYDRGVYYWFGQHMSTGFFKLKLYFCKKNHE